MATKRTKIVVKVFMDVPFEAALEEPVDNAHWYDKLEVCVRAEESWSNATVSYSCSAGGGSFRVEASSPEGARAVLAVADKVAEARDEIPYDKTAEDTVKAWLVACATRGVVVDPASAIDAVSKLDQGMVWRRRSREARKLRAA